MRKLIVLSLVIFAVGGGMATSTAQADSKFDIQNKWIKKWVTLDQNIHQAVVEAAKTFKVSGSLLETIVGREGGNVNPAKLRVTICDPYAFGIAGGGGLGWNNLGSSAFGPFQFLLGIKPACNHASAWGTFSSFDDAAFQAAKEKGNPVPYRFKHPASNVGQAIVAAYMISKGGLHHWCASMC